MQKINTLCKGLVFFVLVFGCLTLHGQTIQHLSKKLNLYEEKYPEESVYLQTDRNEFTPGDVLWFNAIIMEELGNQAVSPSPDFFIALTDQDSLELFNNKFTISGNRASGSIRIPDQLTSGHYMLIAYTGWMKNMPMDRMFAKEIVIDKEDKKTPVIRIKLSDTICARNVTIPAYIFISNKDKAPISASFTYQITGIKDEVIAGKGKTDKQGNAKIDFVLPSGAPGENPRLIVNLSNKGLKARTALVIPTAENYLNVNFFPESGMLLYGADSRIAFRGFNNAGRPVNFAGEIYTRDNRLVKRIWSDYRGIGSFQLTPEKGQTYYLKITNPSGILKTFELPQSRRSGIILSVYDKTPEKLTLSVNQLNKSGQVYHFIGQMKGKIYWMESRKIDKNARVNMPVMDFPGGIAEITVFDTAMNLVAKRLVFINKNKKLTLEVTPDKAAYAYREKVTLVIQVKDEQGNPVHAELSLSAVRGTDQESLPENNLYAHAVLNTDLVGYPPDPAYYFSSDEMADETLDNLLIANAYKRFTWRDIMNITESSPSYNLGNDNSLTIDMKAEKARSAFFAHELANLVQYPGNSYVVQERNDMGKVLIPDKHEEIKRKANSNKDIMELIYEIKPYKLVGGVIQFPSNGPSSFTSQQGAAIAIDGIYRGTDPSVLTTVPRQDVDKIYVSTNPIDIQRYTGLNSQGIIEVYTLSANARKKKEAENLNYDKIAAPLFFQSPDYSNPDSQNKQKTDFRKTIFWDPDLQTDKSGKATITFYNGDLPGDVVIAADGISDNGLVGSGIAGYKVGNKE